MSYFPSPDSEFKDLLSRNWNVVTEVDYKKDYTVFDGAPCDWSREHGATHTLFCGDGPGRGTRPAKLLKTVLYVGVGEDEDGNIVWDKWTLIPSKTLRFLK